MVILYEEIYFEKCIDLIFILERFCFGEQCCPIAMTYNFIIYIDMTLLLNNVIVKKISILRRSRI